MCSLPDRGGPCRIKGLMPHYQIIVDRVGNLDTLEIQVEVTEQLF